MMKSTRILILLLAHLALTCLAMPAFDDSPYPPLDDVTSPPGVASDDGNLYEDYDFDAEPEPGKYKCDKTWLYVEYSRLCDGLQDCDHADDEDPLVCEVFGQVAQMSSSTSSQPPTTTTDASTTTSSSSVDGFDLSIHDYSDVVCADDEFQCSADPGICLPASAACDGESDCSDAEDELFCDAMEAMRPSAVVQHVTPTPTRDQVATQQYATSTSSTEIATSQLGSIDAQPSVTSPPNPLDRDEKVEMEACRFPMEFQCSSHMGDCVPRELLCDGSDDCWDGSDEIGCGCGADQYMCINGRCISDTYRCDGYNDCGDFSDEIIGCIFFPEEVEQETPALEPGTLIASTTKPSSHSSSPAAANETVLTVTSTVVNFTEVTEASTAVDNSFAVEETCPEKEVCLNGGRCVVDDGQARCSCPLGFIGAFCEIEDCTIGNVCGSAGNVNPSILTLVLSLVSFYLLHWFQ